MVLLLPFKLRRIVASSQSLLSWVNFILILPLMVASRVNHCDTSYHYSASLTLHVTLSGVSSHCRFVLQVYHTFHLTPLQLTLICHTEAMCSRRGHLFPFCILIIIILAKTFTLQMKSRKMIFSETNAWSVYNTTLHHT